MATSQDAIRCMAAIILRLLERYQRRQGFARVLLSTVVSWMHQLMRDAVHIDMPMVKSYTKGRYQPLEYGVHKASARGSLTCCSAPMRMLLKGGGDTVKPLIPLIFLGTLCTVVNAGEEVRFVETQEEFARELQLTTEKPHRYIKRGVDSVVTTDVGALEVASREYQIRVRAKIQFNTGAARILPESQHILDNFAEALRDVDAVILVEGHADSVGRAVFNQELSERRAKAVVDYLTSAHGIPQHRLTMRGFGETKPIETNATAEGRAMNRRVEFVRLK